MRTDTGSRHQQSRCESVGILLCLLTIRRCVPMKDKMTQFVGGIKAACSADLRVLRKTKGRSCRHNENASTSAASIAREYTLTPRASSRGLDRGQADSI